MSQRRYTAVALAAVIAALTAISILATNRYRYGTADHCITIPFLKHELNNRLYPADYLLQQKAHYYTYLWAGLAQAASWAQPSLPRLIFAVYVVVVYLTFVAMYLLARTLFGSVEVGLISLVFLLWPTTWLAETSTLYSMLLTKTVALPIVLLALWLFLRGSYVASFALQAVAFLVHPMTGLYVTLMLLAACVVCFRQIGARRLVAGLGLLVLLASPIIVWSLLDRPAAVSLRADADWVALLRLRSAHHIFPLSWSRQLWLRTALVLIVFAASCRHRPPQLQHRMVMAFSLAVLGMCVVGTVFSEVLPIGTVLTLQLFRSFKFVVYFAMIYFVNHCLRQLRQGRSSWQGLLGAPAAAVFFWPAKGWMYGYAVFLAIAVTIALCEALGRARLAGRAAAVVAAVGLCAAATLGYLQGPPFHIRTAQSRAWLQVQRWARDNTDLQDVFIVPPQWCGFRLEAERTIYGDWKDGTLMNFDPDFGRQWIDRMRRLGYRPAEARWSSQPAYRPPASLAGGFAALDEQDFVSLAGQIWRGRTDRGRTFVVRPRKAPRLRFRPVYWNRHFVVYQVMP
ncbi:MAG: DUF6798 domain-containing protein [Phycisphaerae bacterium]